MNHQENVALSFYKVKKEMDEVREEVMGVKESLATLKEQNDRIEYWLAKLLQKEVSGQLVLEE